MKVFILAGEMSGDKLGGALMAGLNTLVSDISYEGIGGPEMQAQGLESLFAMDELSVMGIAEVLPKYRHLKRRIAQTAEAVVAMQPDVLITIDSPDFSLRVAKIVKEKSDIRTVHYVAPTVWAWRPGRAAKMAKMIDQVLALLPFEPPYMEAAGMRCDFVGHPVVAEPVASDAEVLELRERYELVDAPVMLMLPGSRRGEVSRLGPVFGEVLKPVLEARPDLRVVVPAAAPVAGVVKEMARDWPGETVVLDPRDRPAHETGREKRAAFRAASVGLAASGTVSLELAAAGTPMVIAYDLNWLTRQIAAVMVKLDTVTLVNLVSETRTVPEFISQNCRPELIAPAVLEVLSAPNEQSTAMATTMERLGRGGEAPGMRAARAVLAGLEG
ncbi:lipid-A-disaccharide synthase [Shimia abyssi]|uniref:Lipid-A-disaccharide synthase n=1 Tax=Shimia abyssi TaxID=1662395 RepID=A0A2P8F6P4_9RHOB|nr:lipid-A-disaccharide synthase [Shimia abyssi]PSL17394.1 lipid-A-disaccharide synthase [Shimia abyssi]